MHLWVINDLSSVSLIRFQGVSISDGASRDTAIEMITVYCDLSTSEVMYSAEDLTPNLPQRSRRRMMT